MAPPLTRAGTEQGAATSLGLVGAGARWLFAAFAVTMGYLAAASVSTAVEAVCTGLGLLLILAAAGILVSPRAAALRPRATIGVVALTAASAIVSLIALPAVAQPGFKAWYLGAGTFVLFALAVRGRIAAAWGGMTLVIGATVVWSLARTGSPLLGVAISYAQPVGLLAGTFFSIGLQRAGRQIARIHASDARRAAAAAAEAELASAGRERLDRIAPLVRPILESIASGTLPVSERASASVVEAALRDQIRAQRLVRGELAEAVTDARHRGAHVLLLDDADGDIAPAALAEVARWAASRIRATKAREITVRLTAVEGEARVSLRADSMDDALSVRADLGDPVPARHGAPAMSAADATLSPWTPSSPS